MYWPNQYTDRPAELVRAKELFESGRRDEAFELCTEYLTKHPDDALPRITRTLVYIARDQLDNAEQEICLVLMQRPEWSTAWALAGLVAHGQKNYGEAIEHFEKASDLSGSVEEKSKYLFWLADAYSSSRDYVKAVKNLRSSYRLQPTFISGWQFIIISLLKNRFLAFLFVASGIYAAILLPFGIAIFPLTLFSLFLLITAVFFLKTNRLQQSMVAVVWLVALLSIFYFRIS